MRRRKVTHPHLRLLVTDSLPIRLSYYSLLTAPIYVCVRIFRFCGTFARREARGFGVDTEPGLALNQTFHASLEVGKVFDLIVLLHGAQVAQGMAIPKELGERGGAPLLGELVDQQSALSIENGHLRGAGILLHRE